MTKEETLANINSCIVYENGLPVLMDGMFMDSELDSLGVVIVLLTIANDYDIDTAEFDDIDVDALSVKMLVSICHSTTSV